MEKYICPVCGSKNLSRPAYIDGSPSHEVCLCCNFEYGYDDLDQGYTHEQWREKWIKEGMVWNEGDTIPPKGWNPVEQLKNISIKVD